MKMTITITDDTGSNSQITAPPSNTADPAHPATAADAGSAPGSETTSNVVGNGFANPNAGGTNSGANGGAAPEWLRELLAATPAHRSSTSMSAPPVSPAIDAGAGPAPE